jgi:hypothetical protein
MADGSAFNEAHRLAARRALGQGTDRPQAPERETPEVSSVTGPLGSIIGSYWGPVGETIGGAIGEAGGNTVEGIIANDEDRFVRSFLPQAESMSKLKGAFGDEEEDDA